MLVHELVKVQADQNARAAYMTAKGTTVSYADFYAQIERLGAHLLAAGVRRGDRVAIALPNCTPFFVSYFAALSIGAIAVPLSHRTPRNRWRYILGDCSPAIAITSQVPAQVAKADQRGCVREIISAADGAPTAQPGTSLIVTFKECVHSSATNSPPWRVIDVDPAMIVYTSGSTGTPKGILCSHLNIVSAATSIADYLEMRADDRVIDVLPPFFDYGLYQSILCALAGAELVLGDDAIFVESLVATVEARQITGIPLVPSIAASLLSYLRSSGKELGAEARQRVRFITSTGAPFHPKYITGLRAHFPAARIFSMYGLSECKRVAFLDPDLAESRPYSVGKPMKNVEAWVAGEDGAPLGPGELGTLVVRGSNVALGYWGDDDLTRKTFPSGRNGERLLVTNDLFVEDDEGLLYFKGRKDDIIKSGAYRISLKEVCDILLSVNGVSEAAVVPIPDERLGRAMRAFVVLDGGVAISERELRLRLRSLVETGLKVPKEIIFASALPKTATHKVDKRRLQGVLEIESPSAPSRLA